ncbi:MAG: EamA family transporter [Anaerolineales bacterium]|jgi:uncharacterized membrane protein
MVEKTETLGTEKGERADPISRGWRSSLFGLGAALCFSISPVFIRHGLHDLPSSLLGVTIGMIFSTMAYGVVLIFRRGHVDRGAIPHTALFFQFAAGVLVGLSTWARWFALDLAPVGVVVALGRLNVPIVIGLSPLLIGQHLEQVTYKVWLGAGLIIAGAFLLAVHS